MLLFKTECASSQIRRSPIGSPAFGTAAEEEKETKRQKPSAEPLRSLALLRCWYGWLVDLLEDIQTYDDAQLEPRFGTSSKKCREFFMNM